VLLQYLSEISNIVRAVSIFLLGLFARHALADKKDLVFNRAYDIMMWAFTRQHPKSRKNRPPVMLSCIGKSCSLSSPGELELLCSRIGMSLSDDLHLVTFNIQRVLDEFNRIDIKVLSVVAQQVSPSISKCVSNEALSSFSHPILPLHQTCRSVQARAVYASGHTYRQQQLRQLNLRSWRTMNREF